MLPLPRISVHRNDVHPWHGQPGWDRMYLFAVSEKELKGMIVDAQKKLWKAWIVGGWSETPEGKQIAAAVMYKPHGVTDAWEDHPCPKL